MSGIQFHNRPRLPIDDVLAQLTAVLDSQRNAVLVAPPGAGKSTIVPLELLQAPWLAGQRILVLEPRRIAARAVAARMASLVGEALGETVGVRARLGTRVGPRTRVEVITEGVFTRMVIDDPSLAGVGVVIFDEFHERSLDADFGLALALDAQRGLRDDLRLLVMSATIDSEAAASFLGNAAVVSSEGKSFPIETRYVGRNGRQSIEQHVAACVRRALREEDGSILAFLPGQAEIRRTAEMLEADISDPLVVIAPLYGALDVKAQDLAIQPAKGDRRKVVLATAIAETSLTIEGVRVIVDSGLVRVPRYDAGARITRLETIRVSQAGADQRRGRAGRVEPGVCYRLWNEAETQGLRPFEVPEIQNADLTGLALDCAAWGVRDPADLSWLDPPPRGAATVARERLLELGAILPDGQISDHGKMLRGLPVAPHLAAMVLRAAEVGQARDAADLAGILIERGAGGSSSDLEQRLENYRRERSPRAKRLRDLSRRWADTAEELVGLSNEEPHIYSVAGLLSFAFPDRIAKRRGETGRLLMSGGRGAHLIEGDVLWDGEYLVVGEIQGAAASARVLAGARLDEKELNNIAGHRIETCDQVMFDVERAAVRASRVRRLGAITLSRSAVAIPVADDAIAEELTRGIVEELGIARLPWSQGLGQLRARVGFLRCTDDSWPDLSDDALSATWKTWLVPFLAGKTTLADIAVEDLTAAVDAMIPWALRRQLDELAPAYFEAPTGVRHAIDYAGEQAPVVALRVQEVFGMMEHPTIADGRLPLTLVLLSPARRPLQVTQDLPGFWAGSWRDVKAEMKGRYPKHIWPDDPARAVPTTRAKPRNT